MYPSPRLGGLVMPVYSRTIAHDALGATALLSPSRTTRSPTPMLHAAAVVPSAPTPLAHTSTPSATVPGVPNVAAGMSHTQVQPTLVAS